MGMSYSLDLRRRVMEFVASGGGKSEAARRFSVGSQTVYDWLKRKDLAPKRYVRTKFRI
jgi:transposase